MDLGLLELLQHLVCLLVTRDEIHRADVALQVKSRAFQVRDQEIFGLDDPEDVVKLFVADRVDRMSVLAHLGMVHFVGIFSVEPDDIVAVRHQGTDALVAEMKDPLHDILLDLLDGPGLGSLLQQCLDLVLGDLQLRLFPDPEDPDEEFGADAEKPYEWRGDPCQCHHRLYQCHRDRFRIGQADPLGKQLAQHDRDESDDQHHGDDGQVVIIRDGDTPPAEGAGQRHGDARASQDTGHNGNGGDPDLDRGEELVRLLGKIHDEPCILLPFL